VLLSKRAGAIVEQLGICKEGQKEENEGTPLNAENLKKNKCIDRQQTLVRLH